MQAMGGLLDGTTRLTHGGAPLHQMACLGHLRQSSRSSLRSAWSRSPTTCRCDIAALIGCGVLTGVGAALNTADIQPGRHGRGRSAAAASAST